MHPKGEKGQQLAGGGRTSENMPLQVLVSGKRLAAVGTEHHFGRLMDGVEGLEASEGSAGVLRRWRVSVADWARVYGIIKKRYGNEGKGIISCKVYQCHGGGAAWSKGRGMV